MSLKNRISALFCLSLFVIVLTLMVANQHVRSISDDRFSEALILGKQILWDKIVSSEQDHMEANVSALTRNADAIKAIKKNALSTLRDTLEGSYNRLSAGLVITSLRVTDTEGKILQTLPEESKSPARSALAALSVKDGMIKRDIIANNDTIEVVLAFPLYYRGKVAGAVIYGRDVQAIIDDFKKNDSSDLFITINNQLQYSTNAELNSALTDDLIEASGTYQKTVPINDSVFSLTALPLHNQSGEKLAMAFSLKDRTASYTKEQYTLLLSQYGAVLFAILIVAGCYWYMGRLFSPLRQVANSMQDIAAGDGDLRSRLDASSNDETGMVSRSFNNFVEKIHSVITEVGESSVALGSASNDVADIAQKTCEGTYQQDKETEQIATAMNQMTSAVGEVSHRAREAAATAKLTDEDAKTGRNDVESTIQSINRLADEIGSIAAVVNELSSSSSEIGNVVDVIGSIAEQTNLLALNAAIEAARAGEQGRGFAVVADEVRTLASRTQQSTQEIKGMIERLLTGSSKAVEAIETGKEYTRASVEQANKAGESLEKITDSIGQIAIMNSQISKAANDQLETSQEIYKNVNGITAVSKDTAASANKLQESSRYMESQVSRLNDLLNQFKL